MVEEKDNKIYEDKPKIKINLSELEELMQILDPEERIFVQSKQLVKEIKTDSIKNTYDKDDVFGFKR